MRFADLIDDLNDAVHGTFGEEAIYTPKGGTPQITPVSVLLKKGAAELSVPADFQKLSPGGASEWTLEVRASEIDGGIVRKNDKFEIDGIGVFYVNKKPVADARGKEWTCELRAAT